MIKPLSEANGRSVYLYEIFTIEVKYDLAVARETLQFISHENLKARGHALLVTTLASSDVKAAEEHFGQISVPSWKNRAHVKLSFWTREETKYFALDISTIEMTQDIEEKCLAFLDISMFLFEKYEADAAKNILHKAKEMIPSVEGPQKRCLLRFEAAKLEILFGFKMDAIQTFEEIKKEIAKDASFTADEIRFKIAWYQFKSGLVSSPSFKQIHDPYWQALGSLKKFKVTPQKKLINNAKKIEECLYDYKRKKLIRLKIIKRMALKNTLIALKEIAFKETQNTDLQTRCLAYLEIYKVVRKLQKKNSFAELAISS